MKTSGQNLPGARALLTDLYQLTMAYGYWKTGMADQEAVFHLLFRKQPFNGGFTVARKDGDPIRLDLALPGRVNAANAAVVLAAAAAMGADVDRAASALATITDVAGRYRVATVDGVEMRMLLAKNPAGLQEAIDMLAPAPRPVVASINARIADGLTSAVRAWSSSPSSCPSSSGCSSRSSSSR